MLDDFLRYTQTEKRFSEHTVTAYRKDLLQFVEYTGVSSYEDIHEVSSSLIRSWVVQLIDEGYTNVSVNRKISTLRTFFKWLTNNHKIQKDPTKIIKAPKASKKLPSFAQEGELESVKLDELFENNFEGVRDRLMFELFYQTGIRLNELINLSNSMIQVGEIKVLGKRNKERVIPISMELNKLIKDYGLLRSEIPCDNDFLLVLKSGKKLYPKFVYRKINSYLGNATALKSKSPHVLRHTFATHMLNNGAELEVLKDILGHANLSATQVYTHNSFSQLTNIYSQSHPRGRKK